MKILGRVTDVDQHFTFIASAKIKKCSKSKVEKLSLTGGKGLSVKKSNQTLRVLYQYLRTKNF